MSEKRFTNVSIGMEEAYCDFSIIKVGDKIISDGIPTTDAIGICELFNKLNDENKTLKKENEWLRKELKGLNKKYIAFSEATDKRLKEMMR